MMLHKLVATETIYIHLPLSLYIYIYRYVYISLFKPYVVGCQVKIGVRLYARAPGRIGSLHIN